jgi:hypothetical protein
MSDTKTVFETLNSIDVGDKIKKKGKLSYLSWPYAWGELKKNYPDANYRVYENESGKMYWDDGKTAWVKVGVTVNELEHIEYLPIMDFKNTSIPAAKITSFDANKAIQRAMVKAIGRHGLGLYIYAGEDLPEVHVEERPTLSKVMARIKELSRDDDDKASLSEFMASKGITGQDVLELKEKGLQDLLIDINKVFN